MIPGLPNRIPGLPAGIPGLPTINNNGMIPGLPFQTPGTVTNNNNNIGIIPGIGVIPGMIPQIPSLVKSNIPKQNVNTNSNNDNNEVVNTDITSNITKTNDSKNKDEGDKAITISIPLSQFYSTQIAPFISKNQQDKLNIIILSNIPINMRNDTLENLMKLIPNFENLCRIRDLNGKVTNNCFVKFNDILGVWLIDEIFKIVEIPTVNDKEDGNDKEDTKNHIIVHMEEPTKSYINQNINQIQSQFSKDSSNFKNLIENLNIKLKNWYEKPGIIDIIKDEELTIQNPIINEPISIGLEKVPDDLKQRVGEEILQFRDKGRWYDLRKAKIEEEMKKRREESSKKKFIDRDYNNTNDMDIDNSDTDSETELDDDDIEDDYEVEMKRINKEEDLIESRFLIKEGEWKNREMNIQRSNLKEKQRLEEYETQLIIQRKKDIEYFKSFDDDVQKETKELEYYYDHAKWLKERINFRMREIEKDNREEEEEINDKHGTKNTLLHSTGGKIKMSLKSSNTTGTKNNNIGVFVEKEEGGVSVAEQARRVVEAREAADKRIPRDAEGIFGFPVVWEAVDSEMLEGIRPWVRRGLVSVVGEDDDETVGIIVGLLEAHTSARQVVEEMAVALEEDAEPFVAEIWRVLLLEVETKVALARQPQ